jgi:hypothetical protein
VARLFYLLERKTVTKDRAIEFMKDGVEIWVVNEIKYADGCYAPYTTKITAVSESRDGRIQVVPEKGLSVDSSMVFGVFQDAMDECNRLNASQAKR